MNSFEFVQEQKKTNLFKMLKFKLGSRIGRIEFVAILLNWHVFACLVVMIGFLGYWPGNLGMIFYLVQFLGSYSAAVKRMHDFDCSGWWLLFLLIPYVGLFIFAMLLSLYPGTNRSNRFGQPSSPSLKKYCLLFVAPFIFLIFCLMLPFL